MSAERRGGPDGRVATPESPNWLGPAAPAEIARQERGATGPSGANLDYVRRLAAFLRAHGAHDPHVFEIEALAAALVDSDPPGSSIPRRTPCDS